MGRPGIVDAHNDLLLELVLRRTEDNPFRARWLPGLEAGGVALQVCPLYAANAPAAEARAVALAQAGELARALTDNADRVFAVRTSRDLDRDDGRIGLMLSLEGLEPLDGDPAAFGEFWALGARMVSLTWNHANAFAGGTLTPDQGLTEAGAEVVARLAERGGVLDLAHASDATWQDVLELEPAPPLIVTHAGCRAVRDHPRNLSDAQLELLAERDGVLGMMALALVVDPDAPTVERLLDHVDHAVAVMGVEHVGLGADFIDQVAAAEREAGVQFEGMMADAESAGRGRFGLEGLTGPEHYGVLVDGLRRRGYDGEPLAGILGENFLRLFRRALPQA